MFSKSINPLRPLPTSGRRGILPPVCLLVQSGANFATAQWDTLFIAGSSKLWSSVTNT